MKFLKKIYALITLKKLLLLLIILILPFAIYFTFDHYKKNKLHEKNEKNRLIREAEEKIILDSISQVKIWSQFDIDQIGLKEISLRTKYINGHMYYSFNGTFNGIRRLPSNPSYQDKLKIIFLDEDNFEIKEISVPLSTLTYLYTDGKETGINVDDKLQIPKNEYLKFNDWTLGWQITK